MNVLFSIRPSYGHLYPLMPLAFALKELGHEVTIGTGEEFVPRLHQLGFEAHPSGRSILWSEEQAIRRNPALGDSLPPDEKHKRGIEMFARVLPPPTVEDLIPLIAKTRPSMVVFDQADLGAPLAAALAGIPSVMHSYGMPWPPFMTEPMSAILKELWAAHGVEPPEDPIHGNVYIDISPPSIGDASEMGLPHRLPQRPVPFAEPMGELSVWVTEPRDRPLIYVTLGTVVYERVEVLRAVIDGLAGLEVDVLVAVGPEGNVDALGPLPAGVHAQPFVPQDRLLPHLAAIAHHCGSGTMLGGLAYGIPQLALPQGADQFLNASRLAELGAGIALMPDQIAAESVGEGMTKLLNQGSFRRAAGSLKDEIAGMPTPREVAEQLVALVG